MNIECLSVFSTSSAVSFNQLFQQVEVLSFSVRQVYCVVLCTWTQFAFSTLQCISCDWESRCPCREQFHKFLHVYLLANSVWFYL